MDLSLCQAARLCIHIFHVYVQLISVASKLFLQLGKRFSRSAGSRHFPFVRQYIVLLNKCHLYYSINVIWWSVNIWKQDFSSHLLHFDKKVQIYRNKGNFEITSQKFVHRSFEALVVSKRKHLLLLLSLSFLFFHFNKSLLIFGESFKTSTFAIYMTFKPFVLAKLSTA